MRTLIACIAAILGAAFVSGAAVQEQEQARPSISPPLDNSEWPDANPAGDQGDLSIGALGNISNLADDAQSTLLAELAALERQSGGGQETRAQHLARRARRGLDIVQPKPFADRFSGVFLKSSKDTKFVSAMTYQNFISYWNGQGRLGNRLVDIEVRTVGNRFEYSGVFKPGSGRYALWVGADWSGFVDKWKELSKDGFRLIDIETYMSLDGKTRLYTGVFSEGSGGYALYLSTWSKFNANRKELAAKKVYLIDIEAFYAGGATWYLGVYRSGAKRAPLLRFLKNWEKFVADWKKMNSKGKRLVDFEFYRKGSKTRFVGMYEKSKSKYFLWHNVDYESFKGAERYTTALGMRLVDLELATGTCSSKCSNNVIADSAYNYKITGDTTWYRWPVDTDGNQRFVRHTAVQFSSHPKFTLPFNDQSVRLTGAWRYSNLGYHHALDYSKGAPGFKILSMAKGKVQFVGWDNWSGNTVVVSHAGDTWRTIYMHLRDGKDSDCATAKSKSLASLTPGTTNYNDYRTYLVNSGCLQASPAPGANYWGENSHKIPVKVGDVVSRGQFIAWAGNTGPGGKRGSSLSENTHLHMFTVRKDSSDGRWYFTDPYGIYAQPSCYPDTVTGKISGACGRYPRSWKGGRPSYPPITTILNP